MSEDRSNALHFQRLAGRHILVTGAASGIGLATARRFLAEGAQIAVLDQNRTALEEAFVHTSAVVAQADITSDTQVDRAVAEAAEKLGGLDGVVNAAGIMLTGPTTEISTETWRKVIDVNLSGTFYMVKACVPWLRRSPISTIVNIASGAGLLPNAPGLAAYAASKGGVIALTKALASDLSPDIRVNCICPGMVDTPMADGSRSNVGNYALKRIADPSEIASALLFLTSGDSSYVTGATLAVDGGRTFH